MTQHNASAQFFAPPNLIETDCDSISPAMLTLVELEQQQIDSIVETVPGGAKNVQDIYPLSPLQEGMLFHHLLNENGDAYVLSILLELQSRTQADALIMSLQRVIDRHDVLRSAVLWERLPRPVQVVYRQAPLPIEQLVLDPHHDPIAQLKKRMLPQQQRWEIRHAPLVRLQVASDAQGSHWYALLRLHHMICDHQSLRLVLAEALAFLEGREEELPKPVSYRSHIAQMLSNASKGDAEAFFRSKLGKVREPTAPFGLFDVRGDGTQSEEACLTFDPSLSQKVRIQARRLGVSPARLFHAAWGLVVARTSGLNEVVYGTVLLAAQQRSAQAQRMLGMAVNTLPLRLRLKDVTTKELVEQTHRELVELLNHEQVPLTLAQRCSGITGTAPLFTAVLNFRHSVPDPDAERARAGGVRLLARGDGRTNYPVAMTIDDLGDGFTLTAQTDRRVDPRRILAYLQTATSSLLESLEHAPETLALSLPILPESERYQISKLFNETQALYPCEKLVHELFERHVAQRPDAVAIVYEGQSLTYGELNRKANQLARYLRQKGIGPDQLVGVCVDRSVEMVVAILGILKSGGAYVPLDPRYPTKRLEYMLKDSAPRLLLTQERLKHKLPETSARLVALDTEWIAIAEYEQQDLASSIPGLSPRQLAYVIYTSGSTGQPKGVMLEHRGLCNLAAMQARVFRVQSDSRILQFASLSFDACTWEWVMALCNGACLCLASQEDLAPGEPLWATLHKHKITHATLPPTSLGALSSHGLHGLTTLVVAGEACPATLVEQWAPGRQFVNAYGPSETTVCASLHVCDVNEKGNPPIGRPISNTRIYILDARGELVPVAVAGEIWVGGVGVARGYLNRADLTMERFLPDPFDADPQARLYRTGDLGRWRLDGTIEYLGRNDQQVKIRGHRIEIEEIEALLLQHAEVKHAAVVAREDVPGEKRLVAYVVGDRSGSVGETSNGVPEKLRGEIVGEWETLYEGTYGAKDGGTEPSFVGWNSSYTGQPIPEAQMQEWLTCALDRIKGLRPKRVLEIGCGVGLLLQHLAPQCAVYVGTDISTSAIEQLRNWTSGREDFKNVKLLHRSATDLEDMQSGSFDTVVLNSVVQYFPDLEYLRAVLQEAVRLLGPGGKIFIGDVRDFGLLRMFHSAVQLHKAAATVTVGKLRSRIARAVAQEKELVIDPQFFQALPGHVPGIGMVEVQLKHGRAPSELTRYRYDVVLHVGEPTASHVFCEQLQWRANIRSVAQVELALRQRHWCAVRLHSVPNARLARERAALTMIESSDEHLQVRALRLQLGELKIDEVDPETICELAETFGYDVTLSPGDYGCFEVQLLDRTRGDLIFRALPIPVAINPSSIFANDPLEHSFRQQLLPQLREYLKGRLPEYMIPSAWMMLKELPLTPNGKIDRLALPAPQSRPEEIGEYIAPRTELERKLADIWVQLLPVDQVGVQDNFFALGGHSLLIVQLIERLRPLGLHTNVSSVYKNPTLEALARKLTGETSEPFLVPSNLIPPECETITPKMLPLVALEPKHIELIVRATPGGTANIQDIYPLASLQEGILFHHLLNDKGGDTYILSVLLSVSSRDRLEELIAAFQQVIDRNDVLRTAVQWDQLPEPVQVVYREATLPVEELALDEGRDPLEQLKECMRPGCQTLDLRKAPLMRLQVAANPDGVRWYALLQLHHLVFDHESLDIMLAELATFLKGRAVGLPDPVPYRNHVAQVLAYRQTHDTEAFFRTKLAAVDEPTTPFGLLDVYGNGGRIDRAIEPLNPDLTRRIRAQARRYGVSAATLFHVAWALVVSHTSGRDDVVYGTLLLGRLQGSAGSKDTLGMFINTLPLRIRLRNTTAKELVEHTQTELGELLDHEHASLAVAQRCSGVLRSTPLFSSLLNYRHSATQISTEFENTSGAALLAIQSGTNYPIVLSVDDQGESFALDMEADQQVGAHRMISYVSTVLHSLVGALEIAPQTPALSLPILPEYERRRVIEVFNATQTTYPQDKLIHQLFEEQVERTPDAAAVEYERQSITYADLNARSNQLARYLRNRSIGPDQLVGICVGRSVEMVIGMLAVLKAGGAYVPLDPTNPTERLEHLLADAAPRVLLTQERLKSILPTVTAEVITLDTDWSAIAELDDGNLDPRLLQLNEDQLAYVIYTSGSTGKPKGVMVEHRNIVNYAVFAARQFDVAQGAGSLICTSISFDLMLTGLYPVLLCGRTVRLCSDKQGVPALTSELLRCSNLAPLKLTPSHLGLLEDALLDGRLANRVRVLVLGGEPLHASAVNMWRQHAPSTRIFNHYGPTEATVGCIVHELGAQTSDVVPIGRPIANAQVYILDGNSLPVPIGIAGEIFIGGAGVARGYLNRPELTAERFVQNLFSADPRSRMYKTGDLGRWRPDGTVEYLGRNDNQVKIRGFRIELGEIEAHLARHARVKEVVVVAREDVPGEKRLVAYTVCCEPGEGENALDAESLRTHLRTSLPEYMVPSAFVMIERVPLTSNGKLDGRALPRPELGAYVSNKYEPPQGEVEETLAGIWQELLHIERVGRYDNFFELGGHSLLVTRAISRIREALGLELPMRALFADPTLIQLSVRVAAEARVRTVQHGLRRETLTRELRREIDAMDDDAVLARIAELENECGGNQSVAVESLPDTP